MRSTIPARASLLALAATAACGSHAAPGPDTSITPSASLAPAEPAVIALPITIAMSAVQAQLEKALPRADSLNRAQCLAMGGVVCHQYVFRRDTLGLRVAGDRVDVLARLQYRGRVALPNGGTVGSCGYAPEAMRHAELRFATSLYWRSDWRLASRNTALTSALPDPCEVTLLRLDATPLMKKIADAQLAKVAQQVDSAFPALADLRRPADSLWRSIQEPMPLDSLGTVWLLMNPESVGLVPIVGKGQVITTGMTLVAHPRVVSGAKPAVAVRPLPTLTLARPSTGIRVPVQVELPFDEVSRRATAEMVAYTAREALKVTHVDVSGAGDSAVVRLTLAGRMNGALSLAGRPRFDATSRTLVVDDLHYSVESRDWMTRVKATLAAPIIKHAIDVATNGGRLALGAQLDSARTQLTQQVNRPLAPDVAVGGGMTGLTVTNFAITPSAFVVRVLLEGQAGLWAR